MRFINLLEIDKSDPRFIRWNKLASKRYAELSACQTRGDRKKYLDAHSSWREFRKILTNTFGKMCWYSEKFFETSPGDVDHFRPKNRSTDKDGNVLNEDGYWWLAYDYKNYRYCCENCNRRYEDGGKNDCFPVKTGTFPAVKPYDNDENVLLDPCNEDDCGLIRCNEGGCVVSFSSDDYEKERVEISVKVYNLNLFNEERKDLRIKCDELLKRYAMSYIDSDARGMEWALKDIQKLMNPKKSFSSFVRKFIQEEIEGKDYAPEIEFLLQRSP